MANWLFNQVQTDTKEDVETCKRIIEAQEEVGIIPQNIDTFNDGWCYTFESRWTTPDDAYRQIVRENPSMRFLAVFDCEGSGTTGSIWAPGDGTAYIVEIPEPDFGDDNKACDAWWDSGLWNAMENEKDRKKFV